jgi:hypothetical protein
MSFKSPARHLQNIFINIAKNDQPNNPKYVKNLRKNTKNQNVLETVESDEINESVSNNILTEIRDHIPQWGAIISYKNSKSVNVTNTCSIDYYLFAFWVLKKIDHNFFDNSIESDLTGLIKNIVKEIDENNWNSAKEIWINKVMKFNENPVNNTISLFGSEQARFLDFVYFFQKHRIVQFCNSNCNLNGYIIREDSESIFFNKINNQIILYSCFTEKCSNCNEEITTGIDFYLQNNFVFIESANNNIFISDLPKTIKIQNKTYRLLCCTVHSVGHFIGIFHLNDIFYVIDDLKNYKDSLRELNEFSNHQNLKKKSTTVSMYYLI